MNRIVFRFIFSIFSVLILFSCEKSEEYRYTTVENDPLAVRTYILSNGLKVFMSVNDDLPMINASVVVRAGVRDESPSSAGISHCAKHMMSKGTDKFGAVNYMLEKPLLDSLERLSLRCSEVKTEKELKELYHKIDIASFEASRWAIPKEYERLMSAIGAEESYSQVKYDGTVFSENIPSNQIENWIKIQGERFTNYVVRGFYSDLDIINKDICSYDRGEHIRIYDAMFKMLYTDHPYSDNSVVSSSQLLKNISIPDVKEYIRKYYVPNNMAIILSGDFDPEVVIRQIENSFGNMLPNEELKHEIKDKSIITPEHNSIDIAVDSHEAIYLGWKLPDTNSPDVVTLLLLKDVLSNGKAGILDICINQKKLALSSSALCIYNYDCSFLILSCYPKEGQTLDEARNHLLTQIDKLKKGDFDDDILLSSINNLRLEQHSAMESNRSRNDLISMNYLHRKPWNREVNKINKFKLVTKDDIMQFANKFLDENYVAVYGRKDLKKEELFYEKSPVTQTFANYGLKSDFYEDIANSKVKDIEPRFLDFEKDLKILPTQSGVPLLYKHNDNNNLFHLSFVFEMGYKHNSKLGIAFDYLTYLGTSQMQVHDINQQLYKIACTLKFDVQYDRFSINLYGLNENLSEALGILEKIIEDAKPNSAAYDDFVDDILLKRKRAKSLQHINFYKLRSYVQYGDNHPKKSILSENELLKMDLNALMDIIHNIFSYEHKILYYGSSDVPTVLETLQKHHNPDVRLKPVPIELENTRSKDTLRTEVFICNFPGNLAYFEGFYNSGKTYSPTLDPITYLYNEYYGKGDKSIVFLELRKSRELAYEASAQFVSPKNLDDFYYYRADVITENVKIRDVLTAFNYIVNNMPESQLAFVKAKDRCLNRIRTHRITKNQVLWAYLDALKLGLNVDRREAVYKALPSITLDDLRIFHQECVKDNTFSFCVVADEKDLDFGVLSKYGKLNRVSQKDIFGY